MKICFLTLGTRGDVQPYLALAKELNRRGHQSLIATGRSFEHLIEAENVAFYPTELDFMALAQTPEGKAVLNAPLLHLQTAIKLSKEVLNPAYRKTMDDFYRAAQGAAMIIYHPKALGAVDIAVKLGIPAISMPSTPSTYPIADFPCLALTARYNLGAWLNRKSYVLNSKSEVAQIKQINAFRNETLHLPSRKAGAYTYFRGGEEIPIVYPISPTLFKEVKDWNGHVYLPGFFFLETNEVLSRDLVTFLEEGARPLTVTFSSMQLKKPEIFMRKLLSALQELNKRAVILLGNLQLDLPGNDRIFVTKQAPHALLFEKSYAVLHHGGVGTTAAALRAGIPQLIMPCALDQPFWAKRMYQIGCGLEPLSERITKEDLISALKNIEEEKLVQQAQLIGQSIQSEKGIENAAEWLEAQFRG